MGTGWQAAASFGSSLVGGLLDMSGDRRAQNIARQQARQDRDFAGEQNQLARDFASSEREASQAYSSSEWDRQFGAMNQRQDALRRQDWSREDNAIQRLAADARAAGIHPLAALGGGGGSYGTAVAQPSGGSAGSSGSPPMMSSSGQQYLPSSSKTEVFGDAVLAGLDTLIQHEAGAADRAEQDARTKLMRAETAALLADAQSRTTARSSRAVGQNGTTGSTSSSDVVREPVYNTPVQHQVRAGELTGYGLSEDAFTSEAIQTLSDVFKGISLGVDYIRQNRSGGDSSPPRYDEMMVAP